MRKIIPDIARSNAHIGKARHNLLAAEYNFRGNSLDWTVSQCYYAMYHSLLAILFKHGFESWNHECTIMAVEDLIEKKRISISINWIHFIRKTSTLELSDAKSLREEYQYGVKTEINPEILDNLMRNSASFVGEVELELNKKKKES